MQGQLCPRWLKWEARLILSGSYNNSRGRRRTIVSRNPWLVIPPTQPTPQGVEYGSLSPIQPRWGWLWFVFIFPRVPLHSTRGYYCCKPSGLFGNFLF